MSVEKRLELWGVEPGYYFTLKELGERNLLGVTHRNSLYKRIHSGELRAVPAMSGSRGMWVVMAQDLAEYLEKR